MIVDGRAYIFEYVGAAFDTMHPSENYTELTAIAYFVKNSVKKY